VATINARRSHATTDRSGLEDSGLLLVREAGGLVYDHDGSPHGPASRYTIASAPSLSRALRLIVTEAM
jgi:hypothetical protein